MLKFIVDVNEAGQIVGQPIPYEEINVKNLTKMDIVFYIFLVAFLIVIVSKSIVIVRQQSVKIIERVGRFTRMAKAGLSFKIPFVDRAIETVNLRVDELAEDITAKTSDNVFVSVPVKVQYQVIESMAKEAYYALEDSKKQISSYIINIVRSEATSMTMEQVFQSKSIFEDAVSTNLNEKFGLWGFKVVNVLVDNPIPSPEVIASFDKVISSQRLKEAATNEAEAIRIKTVANAKAEAESLTLKAEAYVKQRTAIAEGMKGLFEGNDLANYLVGIDWRDTVRDASNNGAVIMVPTPFNTTIGDTVAAMKVINKKIT